MRFELLGEEEKLNKRNLISSPFPLINSVVQGKQDGGIFAMSDNFFIIHKSGFAYFKPNDRFCDYDVLLDFLIRNNAIPNYFHVYDSPKELVDLCVKNNEFFTIKKRNRIQLKLNQKELINRPESMPSGFGIKKITKENLTALSIFNLDLTNKFWKSEEDFLQNGFGYCIFTSLGEPASICYSACVAEKVVEIDVVTLPSFQHRNLAKITTSIFVKHCIDKGIIANWDCFEDNVRSLKTALNLGFKESLKYEFLSIYIKLNHEKEYH